MRKAMKHNIFYTLILCSVFMLTSCSSKTSEVEHPSPELTGSGEFDEKKLELKAIIVLPTAHETPRNEFNAAEVTALDTGAQTLTNLMASYFSDNPTIIILSPTQTNAYLGSYIGNQRKEAQYIGNQAGADAVLISQIFRFRELDGKKYGANEPASVSFDYQLLHLESGITLCKGSYDETQQTLLSNIFKFGKASKRKFKFVKGADLLQEGIGEKFSQCSHLNKVR